MTLSYAFVDLEVGGDYVRIYAGSSTSSTALFEYDATNWGPFVDVVGTANAVVWFQSDVGTAGRGFKVTMNAGE
jgi:hypothetical protein